MRSVENADSRSLRQFHDGYVNNMTEGSGVVLIKVICRLNARNYQVKTRDPKMHELAVLSSEDCSYISV